MMVMDQHKVAKQSLVSLKATVRETVQSSVYSLAWRRCNTEIKIDEEIASQSQVSLSVRCSRPTHPKMEILLLSSIARAFGIVTPHQGLIPVAGSPGIHRLFFSVSRFKP